MAKQIKRSEIAEIDLYKDIRDSAEKTIIHINDLNQSLETTAKVLKSELDKPIKVTLEGIADLNDSFVLMNKTMDQSIKLDKAKSQAIKSQIEAETKLEKLEQESIKTQMQKNKLEAQELKIVKDQIKAEQQAEKQKKKNIVLTREEIKEKIRLQKSQREERKVLADELILQDKQAGTLQKLTAQNRVLRRERDKLNLSTEEGKKRLKEINEELDENNEVIQENSDKLKKQKMNVGNYTESIEKALGPLGEMLQKIRASITELKNQAKAFMIQAKSAETASKKIRLVGKALKAIGIGALIAVLSALVSTVTDTRSGILTMQGTIAKAQATIVMFGNVMMDKFEKISIKIKLAMLSFDKFKIKLMEKSFLGKKLFDGLFDIDTEKTKKEIADLEKRLEVLANKEYNIGEVIEGVDKSIMALFEYENQIAKTSVEIERLKGVEGGLIEQAGDMTLSFREQREAQAELVKVVNERMKLEKENADANVDLKAMKIRSSLLKAGKVYELQQIKNLEFLKDEAEWMKINSDSLDALAQAKVEQVAVQNEMDTILGANKKRARETDKDDFEKQLDFAIDFFEVNKNINMKIIEDEKTTLAEREAMTEETRRLSDSSFQSQIKLVEDYTGKRLDFDKLIKISDEAELRRILEKKDLNETTQTRILEILKERKLVLQELDEAEDATAEKRIAKNQEIEQSIQNIEQDDFDLKIELLEKEFEKEKELREKSFEDEKIKGAESVKELKKRLDQIKQAKIDQLKDQAVFDRKTIDDEVVEEDEKAQKIKEVNEKLKNDIIRLEQETLKAKKEVDEQEIESEEKKEEKLAEVKKQRAEDQVAIIEALTDASIALADKRIAKIDEEINASQKRFDSLQTMAENGNILAKESMAEEAKLMAEQNRKREQMEKRKQRIQLASTVLQTYLTNSQDPEVKNPLQKTITDTVLLTEFIKALPMFLEGTEDTGRNGNGVDGKGGFLSVLHPNERVIPKKNNELIGSMSNEDLSQLAYNYQNGLIRDVADGLSLSSNMSGVNIIADKLDTLQKTIQNKPEHNLEIEQIIDGAMAITRSTKKGNTNIYNRYRVSK